MTINNVPIKAETWILSIINWTIGATKHKALLSTCKKLTSCKDNNFTNIRSKTSPWQINYKNRSVQLVNIKKHSVHWLLDKKLLHSHRALWLHFQTGSSLFGEMKKATPTTTIHTLRLFTGLYLRIFQLSCRFVPRFQRLTLNHEIPREKKWVVLGG